MRKRIPALLLALLLILGCAAWGTPEKAEAASPTSLSAMVRRAEEISGYRWVPAEKIMVWNPVENEYNGLNYFPKGKEVVGMPYTLFTNELGFPSQKSFSQYKKITDENRTGTAYCNSVKAMRTGPIYGGCCATFMCEVLGGGYVSGDSARYWTVSGIRGSSLSAVRTGVKVKDLRPGDCLVRYNNGHIMFIGDVSDTHIVLYEMNPPVARKVAVKKSTNTNSSGYFIYLEDGKYAVYNAVVRSRQLVDDSASMAPIAPIVTLDRTKAGVGESVLVSWNALSNASYYRVRAVLGGSVVVDKSVGKSTSFRLEGLEAGRYSVWVTASNQNGASVSDKAGFRVEYIGPELSLRVDDRLMKASWETAGAEEYRASLLDAEGKEILAEAGAELASLEAELSPGTYTLKVTAVYPAESKTSEKVFSVTDLSLSSGRSIYTLSESPSFSYAGAKSYTYALSRTGEESEETVVAETEAPAGGLELDPLPAGEYLLSVTGITGYGMAHASLSFAVADEEEHDYTEEILAEGDCTKEGKKRLVCSACGESHEETIPASGHDWREEGNDLVCALCGAVKKDHRHVYETKTTVPAGAEAPAYAVLECSCGKQVLAVSRPGSAGELSALGKTTGPDGTVRGAGEAYATGDLLAAEKDGKTILRLLAVLGDVDSDGRITSRDYVRIKNHIMEVRLIADPAERLAADSNMDGKITSLDYVRVKNTIMGR